jgi:RNA polymerase sigma-70 factor (ECF subfamily)
LRPSFTEISDETILSLIQKKQTSEKGFRLLMDKYQEKLYHHIRRMVIEHEDANDVLQNCFIKIFRSIHKFKGKSKLYTWLYRIATNEAITWINKKKRKGTNSLDDGDHNLAQTLRADCYFDGDEVQVQLQLALRQLPDKQRTVFNMRYFDEMSYKEIAELLDTSVGGLKASYHHAVKKIEKYFKEVQI